MPFAGTDFIGKKDGWVALRYGYPCFFYLVWELGIGQRYTVLDIHLIDINICCLVEIDIDGAVARHVGVRGDVAHSGNAVDLLLQGIRHRLLGDLCIGASKGCTDQDQRIGNVWQVGNGQDRDRDQPR